MKCDVCIRKELYAECRVAGGTAVYDTNPYDSTVITRSCVSIWRQTVLLVTQLEDLLLLEVCDHEVPLV